MANDHPRRSPQSIRPEWAWAVYQPSAENPWDRRKVAHLYRRAGFGSTWAEQEAALRAGPGATIDRLLDPPGRTAEHAGAIDAMGRLFADSGDPANLQAWWLRRMIHGPDPLTEKMTLFWHGHFATSQEKVQNLGLMYRQNNLLRRHALGHFGPLLREIARDPAMLIWLDAGVNHKLRPNENFARELMELFSLGIGHYTETDVKQAARAFTGWFLFDGRLSYLAAEHDPGPMTVLGRTGRWTDADVVRICLDQPAVARFLVGKLYRFLVSEADPPAAELLEPLAGGFRARDYDIRWLVETILRSNRFFSPRAYRRRIKGPVELAVGAVRGLLIDPAEGGSVNQVALAQACARMGQGVFFPPTVKGWDGGRSWINSSSLLARANLVTALLTAGDPQFGGRLRPAALAAHFGRTQPIDQARLLIDLLVEDDLSAEVRTRILGLAAAGPARPADPDRDALARTVAIAVMTLPEYQLD